MTKGSHKNTKKNKKGKGNESKPNQTTGVKHEMKFTSVGKYGNFTPFNTVKDDFVVELQSMPYKAKVQIIEAIRSEIEPDWDAMKPEKEIASYDPDIRSFRAVSMVCSNHLEQISHLNESFDPNFVRNQCLWCVVQTTCSNSGFTT